MIHVEIYRTLYELVFATAARRLVPLLNFSLGIWLHAQSQTILVFCAQSVFHTSKSLIDAAPTRWDGCVFGKSDAIGQIFAGNRRLLRATPESPGSP